MNQSIKETMSTLIIASIFLIPVTFLKTLSFVLLLIVMGRIWGNIIRQIVRTRYGVMTWILGMYTVFTLMGFFASIVVVWYSLHGWLMMIPLVMIILCTYLMAYIWEKKRGEIFYFPHLSIKRLFKGSITIKIMSSAIVLCAALSLYVIFQHKSIDILMSPWLTIPSYVAFLFMAMMALLAGIIYFSRNARLVVFLFVIVSFVMHAYIPLAHVMPWGGDVWRHIAVEQKMMDGGFELPVLFGKEAHYSDIGLGFFIPDIFISPYKYSYGNLWGTTILVSEVCGLDLNVVNKWLVPVLWSIIMPILLFLLGRVLYRSPRRALWFVWILQLIFSIQVSGSFSLPVSFGLPIFLLGLLLWLYYMKRRDIYIRNIVYALSMLMLFSYALYLVLLLCIIGLTYLYRHVRGRGWRVTIAIMSIFYVPLIELLSYTSRIDTIDIWHNAKQMIGTMSGMFYALMIRPHDIVIGNIFFNHTPLRAYVPDVLTMFRWHIVLVMIVMWGLFVWGLWYIFFKKKNRLWTLMGTIALSTVGGYILSLIFLGGDHMFARRLDLVIAITVVGVAFYIWSRKISRYRRYRVVSIIALIMMLWFGGTAYMSGPDMRVVSTAEYEVSRSIFAGVVQGDEVCVLGDTWLLLALEGISSESIKAGNFPLEHQFAQTDRVRLYEELKEGIVNPEEIYHISGRDVCILIVPQAEITGAEKVAIEEKLSQTADASYGFFRWLIKNEK